MSTSARLLKLLSLLQTRRDWSGDELADRLEVSGRTIRRDVERLRDLGYPVDALSGPSGGYRLKAGTAMPPLLLDDDEAVAIAVGLRTAAGAAVTGIEETSIRALVKLEQVLPSHLRRRVNALQSVTDTFIPTGPTVDPECLTVIAGAARDVQRLRFLYCARGQTESRREVEPHRLVTIGRRWYLVAWDTQREDWRTFRVDRLSEPAATGVRFSPRELPETDATAYVLKNLSGAVSRYQARVTLHAPAAELEEREHHLQGRLRPLGPSSCELTTADDRLDWLAMRIGMLGVAFEIHEPPELVAHVAALGERCVRAARASRSDPPRP